MRTAKQRSITFIFVFVCEIGCKKGIGVCIAAQLELLWVGRRDSLVDSWLVRLCTLWRRWRRLHRGSVTATIVEVLSVEDIR